MVRLFVENTNLPGPVAAVRWCVDKVDLEFLKEKGITNPFLVLMVTRLRKNQDCDSNSDDEPLFDIVDQKVVSLDQAMIYLEFRGSGEFRIFGQLAWCRWYTKEKLNKKRLNEHVWEIIDYHRSIDLIVLNLIHQNMTSDQLEYGYVDVFVPEGHFAKEPSEWEKWWVNFWYESKPKNQCQFRKRRMLAYSVQPPVVIPYTLIRSLIFAVQILLNLLVGMRKIHYRAVFHPLSYEIGDWDIVSDSSTSVFVKDSKGKDRNPFFLMLVPAVQLVILLVACLVWSLLFDRLGSLWVWFGGLNFLIFVIGQFSAMGWLDKFLQEEEIDRQKEARIKRKLELLYDQYQDMVCAGVPLRADISALPLKRRTFYLKFQDLKRRVCLPFAQ